MIQTPDRLHPDPANCIISLGDFIVPSQSGSRSIPELLLEYMETDYGQHQAGQPPRFVHDFGYDPIEMRKELGMDVDPIDHQILTGYFTGQVIRAQLQHEPGFITPRQISTVVFAATFHDIGENTHPDLEQSVGDIPFGRKTDKHRAVEAAVVRTIMDSVFADVDQDIRDTARGIIAHKDRSVLHELYEAAHCLQTLQTARIAEAVSQRKLDQWIRQTFDIATTDNPENATLAKMAQEFKHATRQTDTDIVDLNAHRKAHKLRDLSKAVIQSQGPRYDHFAKQFVYLQVA